jgi:hypothetical protein
MTCPKCGETRLIERVDGHRWFCAVCAHSWTVGARNDVMDRAGYSTRRNTRPSRRRFFGSPRPRQGIYVMVDWHEEPSRRDTTVRDFLPTPNIVVMTG